MRRLCQEFCERWTFFGARYETSVVVVVLDWGLEGRAGFGASGLASEKIVGGFGEI